MGRVSDVVVRGAGGTLRDTAGKLLEGDVPDAARDVGSAAADGLGAVGSAAGKALGGLFGRGGDEE